MAIRYRRNIDCLGTDALHDLREALATMFTLPAADEHGFAALAGLHGTPGNFCRHGAPGFLTWHRAYMFNFERALRCIDSSITLPFWDWSSGPTTGVPPACANPTYVNRTGATFVNFIASESGATAADVIRAFTLAREIFDALRLVVKSEPGGLADQRCDRESRALLAAILMLEIDRSFIKIRRDDFAQSG